MRTNVNVANNIIKFYVNHPEVLNNTGIKIISV